MIYPVWSEKAIKRYPESRVGPIEKVWLSEKMGSNEKKRCKFGNCWKLLENVGNIGQLLATIGKCWQQ